jgi:hypothetical protein
MIRSGVWRSIVRGGSASALLFFATQCIPDRATGVWFVYPGDYGVNDTGESDQGVLVVGDSLVHAINFKPVRWDYVESDRTDPEYCCVGREGGAPYPECLTRKSGIENLCDTGTDELAESMRLGTGKSSFVAAAGGASLSHFVKASLLEQANLRTLADYVALRKPSLTVLALGTNDVRILESAEQDDLIPAAKRGAYGYNIRDFKNSLSQALDAAFTTSRCVVLVNVGKHFGDPRFENNLIAVNDELAARAAADPERVRLADWFAHSAARTAWFLPNNIHHTPEGTAAYATFIVKAATEALNSGC